MDYITIKNWERYQHFTDGRPVKWVKVYVDLLDKYDREGKENAWRNLSDKAVRLCVALWLLRGRYENIPNDSAWIEAQTGVAPKFAVQELIQCGFVTLSKNRNESGTNPVRDCDETKTGLEQDNTESGSLDLRVRDRVRDRDRKREPSAPARASSPANFPDIPSWYPDICALLKAAHPHADIPKAGSAQERDWIKCLVACANKHGEEKVRDTLTWVFRDEPQPDDSTAFTLRRNIKSLATLTNRWKSGLTKIATAIERYENRDAVKAKKREDDEPTRPPIAERIREYRKKYPDDPEDYVMREVCDSFEYAAWVEQQQRKRASVATVRQPGNVTRLGDVLNTAKVSS